MLKVTRGGLLAVLLAVCLLQTHFSVLASAENDYDPEKEAKETERKVRDTLRNYEHVYFGVMIAVGLVWCLFGLRLLKFTVFVTGFVFGSLLIYSIVAHYTSDKSYSPALSISVGILSGLVIGVAFIFLVQVGIFALGVLLGIFLASLLQGLLFQHFGDGDGKILLYVAMGVLGLLFGVLAIKFRHTVVIVSTALCGSYQTVFSIGHFAGKFPDILIDRTPDFDDLTHSTWHTYAYIGGIFALFLVGLGCQYHHYKTQVEPTLKQKQQHHHHQAGYEYQQMPPSSRVNRV